MCEKHFFHNKKTQKEVFNKPITAYIKKLLKNHPHKLDQFVNDDCGFIFKGEDGEEIFSFNFLEKNDYEFRTDTSFDFLVCCALLILLSFFPIKLTSDTLTLYTENLKDPQFLIKGKLVEILPSAESSWQKAMDLLKTWGFRGFFFVKDYKETAYGNFVDLVVEIKPPFVVVGEK